MSDEELHVLLVEDNPGDATLVEHHLRQGSVFDVADEVGLTTVESIERAREDLETGGYDLVLLDLGLPESSGLDTLDRIVSDARQIPIVVLTGLDDHETAVQAIQHGAQDYLPKGELDTDRLMRSLRYAVEREKQERQLRQRTEQLELFNSVLRHDVQNGMDVVRQNAILLTERLDGEDRERAETIRSWTEDMIDLTEKVRRMLSATTGDERDLTAVDCSEALREQVDRVAEMDGVNVDASIPDGLVVEADELLSSVFGNVLTNAVEHNDREPEITIDAAEDGDTVRVRIADNGPGIPPELREQVFGRGVQAEADGGGFGLYFVATMVDAYGGSLTVADNEPRGSVFEIRLPTPLGGDRPA